MPRIRINVTLDEDTLKEIQESAAKYCRSVSGEIEYRMKYWAPVPVTPITPLYIPHDTPPVPITTPTPPFNPTSEIIVDGKLYKKHPLVWLRENNIDPNDMSMDTYARLRLVFPDINLDDFDEYQRTRQKNKTEG